MPFASFRRCALSLLLVGLLAVPAAAQGLSPDYSKGNAWFPVITSPYTPKSIPQPDLANSPRLEDLIRDGKLFLSLQDAIYLALENNLDISVQRYGPSIAETDLLRARGGGIARGAGGLGTASALGGGGASLDPVVTSTLSWRRTSFPVNNPVTSGTGLSVGSGALTTNTTTGNFQYSQGFMTGTSYSIAFNNSRQSTTSLFSFFNPRTFSTLSFSFSQPLLNGFGYAQNKRFILVSKNNLKISNRFFAQQVMDIVSNVKRAYWELIFAREDVKVKERSLALAEKLYNDNQRQVEIGTMARIEVVRAESEVARNRQDLIISQTNLLQQQISMKDLLSKNPTDPLLALVEIETLDSPQVPDVPEILPVQDAIQIAMEKRPELAQAQLDLKNQAIHLKAVRRSMLPTVTAFGFYGGTGLSGIGGITDPVTGQQTVLVNRGLGTSVTQALQGDFPDYGFGLSITIPLKNRQAQADMARQQIEERRAQTRYRRTVNSIIVEVRNAQIALEQNRARIDAAVKARGLAQETLDAEQKKFQLGASTIFLVIQAQRDLAQARSQEVRSLVDFERARVDFDRALGRTFERSHITLEDAKLGTVTA
ncbi:MAG: TolC family protein, partial [Terriglobia bacterium]